MVRKIMALTASLLILMSCDNPSSSNGSSSGSSNTPAPKTPLDTLHYAAIGASDIVGYGSSVLDSSYAYMIRDSLATYVTNLEFTNFGFYGYDYNVVGTASGSTVQDMINEQLPLVKDNSPDLITIWTGGNDFVNMVTQNGDKSAELLFEEGLNTLLRGIFNDAPDAFAVIANLPNMSQLPATTEYIKMGYITESKLEVQERTVRVNTIIKNTVAKYDNCYLVDLYSSMNLDRNDNYISEDGFHPSDKGYRAMANRYMNVINGLFQD